MQIDLILQTIFILLFHSFITIEGKTITKQSDVGSNSSAYKVAQEVKIYYNPLNSLHTSLKSDRINRCKNYFFGRIKNTGCIGSFVKADFAGYFCKINALYQICLR